MAGPTRTHLQHATDRLTSGVYRLPTQVGRRHSEDAHAMVAANPLVVSYRIGRGAIAALAQIDR